MYYLIRVLLIHLYPPDLPCNRTWRVGGWKPIIGSSYPNDSMIDCPISYKHVPITIGGTTFPIDLIQFDLSDFDIILEMNWLPTYGAKIDCENLKVILKDEKGRVVCFYRQREENAYPLISAMKASKLLC